MKSTSALRKEPGSTSPRVLFVDHSGAIGGGQLVLEKLATSLPFTVSVALLSPGPILDRLKARNVQVSLLINGQKLVSLGKETPLPSRLWALRHVPRILRTLSNEAMNADVVYANSKKALFYAALAAWRTKRMLIWHQHDEMHVPASLALRGRLSELMLVGLLNHRATRVISVSKAAAETSLAAGVRPDLPVVVYNGLSPERYSECVDRDAVRRDAGLPVGRPLIGCFGRLTIWKGQAILIKALRQIPDAHVALVGGTAFGESGYEAALRGEVKRQELAGRIHFLGHRDDIPQLMKSVDVVAHPSTEFDPCPLVVLEALHSGVPIVATAVGGVPELIQNGVNGLLVPAGDPDALARALTDLLCNPVLSGQLSEKGRERALNDFTLERLIAQIASVVRNTVDQARS